MKLKNSGVYTIKEEFFEKHQDKYLSENRGTGRPYYYVYKDKKIDGIYWLIPMSTKLEKAINKINTQYGGNEEKCPFYVINTQQKKSVFLIGNVFPITEKYIESEFIETLTNKPLVIKDTKLIQKIEKKTAKYINYSMRVTKENTINLKKLLNELTKELKQEKNISQEIVYNPLTGHELKTLKGYKLSKYDTNQWISKVEVEKNNLKVVNGSATTVPVVLKKDDKLITKDIEFYNIAQLDISKEFKKEHFKDLKIEPKKEQKISKEKSRSIER
jgi:hypothetical protein